MKTVKGTAFCATGIVVAVVAIGIGDAITKADNGWMMIAYAILSILLLMAALVLCALGVNAENEYADRENRKVRRVPNHTNEWRDAQ